ncbi:hypothetical protein X798_07205, partial [Onchocerca flexuosa]
MAGRGILPIKLRYSKLWWNGPCWLDRDPSQLPNDVFSYNAEDEITQAIMTILAQAIAQNYEKDKIQFIETHRL